MVKTRIFNIFTLTAFFTAVTISLFSIKPRNGLFACLIESENIAHIQGTVASNPTLTSKKNFYRCKFNVEQASSNDFSSQSSAQGCVMLLVPAQIVEAHYPKKLYSASSSEDVFIETGARLALDVSCVDKNAKLFSVKSACFLGWKNKISFIRANCRLNFKRLCALWGEAGGFLLALLASSREYTDDTLAQAFCLAGLSHILALSGMHVGIFSGFTKKIFKSFAGKRLSDLFALFSVILFVWFAGFSPSLSRALIACIISFFATILCIKANPLTMLSISFLIQILIFPTDFSSISFMLSYLSLLGIVLFSVFFSKVLCRFTGTFFSKQLSPSISAIIMTSPLSSKIFGFIAPIGIFSSMIISPLVTYFLIGSLVCIVLSLIFPFLSFPLGKILEIIYYSIKYVGIFFAKFPPITL